MRFPKALDAAGLNMADKKKLVRPPSRTAGLLQLPVEGVPKMPQGLLSYEPTLREKIANAVYDGSVGLLGKRKAHEMQANTKSAVDFVPGLGDAVGANDMARDYRAGNYGMAALSAIGLIPAVGDVASKAGKKIFKEGSDELLKSAINKAGPYKYVGLRSIDDYPEILKSRIWENGEPTKKYLSGLSVTDAADFEDAATKHRLGGRKSDKWADAYYPGEYVAVIGGNKASKGLDENELIIDDAQIIEFVRKYGEAGKKALANAPEGIRAFHGSPHSFDKFSLDKIGTGEGAQAYGPGLYFADNEGVAKSYRDTLSRDARPSRISDPAHDVAQQYIKDAGGDRELAAKTLLEYAGTDPQTMAIADYIRNPPGSMYEVNIRANPDDFLDWDKPLSEQPKAVQEMARNADLSKFPAGNRTRRQIEMWRDGTLPNIESSPTGGTLHNALTDYGWDDISRTSLPAKLASQGIPGIKYLDAGSRGAGDGSRNYVVFDEKLIEIVRKYGLASAIGAGIISKEMGQQMQAQGDI